MDVRNKSRLRYVFIGNRYFVLQKMLELNCDIKKIYAVKDSFLEKYLKGKRIEYTVLPEKSELYDYLLEEKYDVLISNGCPYILPISKLQTKNRKFINIHPSLLPDLKGKSPINGALLYNRKHGVTCHYMNDSIDDGAIISQIEIPITPDIDLDLLYQISFLSEGLVFEKAFINNFKVQEIAKKQEGLYYSRKDRDMLLESTDLVEEILKKVRAFCSKGQYAKIIHGERVYEVKEIKIIENAYVDQLFIDKRSNTIIMIFGENRILAKIKGKYLSLRLNTVEGLTVGGKLFWKHM